MNLLISSGTLYVYEDGSDPESCPYIWPRDEKRKHKCTVRMKDCHLVLHVDMSALLENTPLIQFIRNYIWDASGIFSISLLVRILMTSLPAFSWL